MTWTSPSIHTWRSRQLMKKILIWATIARAPPLKSIRRSRINSQKKIMTRPVALMAAQAISKCCRNWRSKTLLISKTLKHPMVRKKMPVNCRPTMLIQQLSRHLSPKSKFSKNRKLKSKNSLWSSLPELLILWWKSRKLSKSLSLWKSQNLPKLPLPLLVLVLLLSRYLL